VADQPASRIALVLDAPLDDVAAIVAAARAAGGIDRSTPRRGDGRIACDVHWGGRMERGVVRMLTDEAGVPLLRTEASIAGDGVGPGLQRQAALLQALARVLPGRVRAVRDESAHAEHDLGWLPRIAVGAAEQSDAIATVVTAAPSGAGWIRSHGAARFAVPDLELYGLAPQATAAAVTALTAVHAQLLAGGLASDLVLPGGLPVRLVPVLEAWAHLPLAWPGVGRAGVDRGPGLDGPRATLSVLHRARLGRHRLDLAGVTAHLVALSPA